MKEIKLSRGFVAIVDDEDYERLNKYNWWVTKKSKDKCFYAIRSLKRVKIQSPPGTYKYKTKIILMHNDIATSPVGFHWDHVNRNGLDNRKCNLRPSTIGQNNCNQGKRGDSKNPYRGIKQRVLKSGKGGLWIARIKVIGNRFESKGFKTAREAAEEYNRMAQLYHGEFAGLNVFE